MQLIRKNELTYCPKCKHILIRRKKIDQIKNLEKFLSNTKQKYLFVEYDKCSNCRHIQHYEHYKMLYSDFVKQYLCQESTLF